MDDNAIDSAIDDVAKEMTAGELHASFRARIVERIDAGDAGRSWFVGSWFHVRALAGVAVVAAVLVVSWLQLRQPRHASRPAITEPAVASQRSEDRSLQVEQSEPPERRSLRIERSTPPESRSLPTGAPRSRRLNVAIAASDVDALAPPPLDVESIAVAELPPPASIQLDHLQTVASIAVAPLSTDDQGERR